MKLLFYLILLIPCYCYSQDIILPNINIPVALSVSVIRGAVLSENLIGPRKIIFSGNQMDLQRKEIWKNSSGYGVRASNIDLMPTFYSGRIFSPGIIKPYIFTNKTSSELMLIEVTVFPVRLEEPYTLFIDLEVQTSSKPSPVNQSNDAGIYDANINIILIQI